MKEKIINILLNSSLVRSKLIISIGRIIHSFSKSDFVEIEGRKMFTQNNDGLALSIFKIYEPNQVESKWYKIWDEQGLFQPENNKY